MYEIIKEINSLNEYVDFIYEYKMKTNTELWYRGHGNNLWLLDPSLNRNKIMDNVPGKICTLKYKNVPNFTEEIKIFKESIEGQTPDNYNDFHFMFLGQHYGLKTLALDWSTDPLVALYFAIDGYQKDGDTYPVIFVLKPCFLNEYSAIVNTDNTPIKEPLSVDLLSNNLFQEWFSDINNTPFSLVPLAVKSDYDISYRISRQSGVFTLHDTRQPLNYSWIQTNIGGETFGITLKINPNKVDEINQHLIALNVTKKSIYGSSHKEWDELCEKIVKNIKLL